MTNGLFRFWVFPDCTFLDISILTFKYMLKFINFKSLPYHYQGRIFCFGKVHISKLIKERMCHGEETSNSQLVNISVVSHLVARTGVRGRYRRRYTRTGG